MTVLARDAVLGDRYRLDARIAVGGMGEVWRARDTLLDRMVAVKVLKNDLATDQGFLDRFRNEARSAAAFTHSGIAGVFDYGETTSDDLPTAYLVMELVHGEPLSAILARVGRLALDATLDYVGQAAVALQVAHRGGLVHRDIKPGNLLVTPDGQVKITDFGVARAASMVPLTQAGMVVGTAQYFSPEQAEGHPVGPASDVYSLGVVAFECLAGHLPFTADSPITVAMMQIRNVPPPLPPDVPPPVRAVVERAMAKDPRVRYWDGAGLAAAIRAAREGRPDPVPVPAPYPEPGPGPSVAPQANGGYRHPVPVDPWPAAPRPPTGRSRSGSLLLLVLAAVLIGVAVTVWLLVQHDESGRGHPSSAPARNEPNPTRRTETGPGVRAGDNPGEQWRGVAVASSYRLPRSTDRPDRSATASPRPRTTQGDR